MVRVQSLMLDLSREDQLACPEVQGQILSINANHHPIPPALPLLTASQLAAEPFPLSLMGQSKGAIPLGSPTETSTLGRLSAGPIQSLAGCSLVG